MAPKLSPKFTFQDVAKPDRIWLKRASAEIGVRLRQTSKDLLIIGRLLLQARRRLGSRGRFGEWVDAEILLSRRTVSRLMQVARAFGSLPHEVVQRIAPTALYTLSEPSVPQAFREYIAEEATAGRLISASEAAQLLTDHLGAGQAPLALARSKDPPRKVDADEVHAASNWKLLLSLLATGTAVHLDTWGDNEGPVFSILRLAEGKPQQVVSSSLEKCLLELVGVQRVKACAVCGREKPLNEFSRAKDNPDGRNRRCLICERQRVKAANDRKRLGAEE